MTRILLLSPADADLLHGGLPDGLLDGDTRIVHRAVAYASCPPVGAHDWALADLAVLAAGQRAQEEGFDAVCLADSGDYGANALRSVVDIPVVAAGRSAMLHALSLGARFTVLATERDHVRVKKLVHDYGFGGQCAGIRLAGGDGVPRDLAGQADVLVLAGETRDLGADLPGGVPAVDPVALAVKLAESFVGLGLTHSRVAYPEPQTRKAALIEAIAR